MKSTKLTTLLVLLIGVMALLVVDLTLLGLLAFAFGAVLTLGALIWRARRARRTRGDLGLAEGFSEGDAVEVDCRLCGQFNRVLVAALRKQRPLCGRCKTRLMPGKRIVCCRVSRFDPAFSKELDKLWEDEDALWDRLEAYMIRPKTDARPEQPTSSNRSLVN